MVENSEENIKDIAVLIGIDLDKGDEEMSIDELERLADTAGMDTFAKILQKRDKIDAATYIGRGKLEEIKELCKPSDVNIAVIDDELKGSQIREIEEILDMRVIDRSTLILDIFASRAKSAEGRLQVELAQYKYRLPRLQGYGTALSRLGGGIGTRGPGETKLETDRRHINRRIAHIEKELEQSEKRRELTRDRRKKDTVPLVALIGYTNAGKSSLMNRLCSSADVHVKDQLFATLDPTVRRMDNDDNENILIIDTVGFIRKLPHDLIEAFKSTLEESLNADLLLHVMDISDAEADTEAEIVENLLKSLGADSKPRLKVWNKCDLVPETVYLKNSDAETTSEYYVSAKDGKGTDMLIKRIISEAVKTRTYTLLIPYTDGSSVNRLHGKCKIISESHTDNGTLLKVKLDEKEAGRYAEYII